ncbi:hypothetical protein GCM10022254_05290 [Actinomadura meridiana]|uniref:Uncharacterized protein n=1 Tax=Actinomadura meridiana TaxID=559626 RepID=A0ABP8BSI5_9ACTN
MGTSGNADVPDISHEDPLHSKPESEGRWDEPYLSKWGMWAVCTRRPLTAEQVHAGLASIVTAETLPRLRERMADQDKTWEKYEAEGRSNGNTR